MSIYEKIAALLSGKTCGAPLYFFFFSVTNFKRHLISFLHRPPQIDSETKANVTCAVFNYDGSEVIGSYNDDDVYLFKTGHSDGADYRKRYQGHRNHMTGVYFILDWVAVARNPSHSTKVGPITIRHSSRLFRSRGPCSLDYLDYFDHELQYCACVSST